jgi:hypothetical protein
MLATQKLCHTANLNIAKIYIGINPPLLLWKLFSPTLVFFKNPRGTSRIMYTSLLALLAAAGSVVATGRPSSVSICDYYTTALLTDDTPANQYLLLTLLVNTVVIGNYTQPNVGVSV